MKLTVIVICVVLSVILCCVEFYLFNGAVSTFTTPINFYKLGIWFEGLVIIETIVIYYFIGHYLEDQLNRVDQH